MAVSINGVNTGWAELGLTIREHRRAAGLTLEQLAERADLHWTYISEIENNRRNPSLNVLRKLAGGLGLRLSVLISDAEDK